VTTNMMAGLAAVGVVVVGVNTVNCIRFVGWMFGYVRESTHYKGLEMDWSRRVAAAAHTSMVVELAVEVVAEWVLIN